MLELSKIEEFFKCGVISITEVIKKTKKYGTVYFQHGFEKGTILFVTHKKWPFSSDFKVKCEKGEVISGVWKHCPKLNTMHLCVKLEQETSRMTLH